MFALAFALATTLLSVTSASDVASTSPQPQSLADHVAAGHVVGPAEDLSASSEGVPSLRPSAADSVRCAPSTDVPADKSQIIIHVLDANTSARISAARLFVNGAGGGREFETDARGGRQIDGVPPGEYLVLADAPAGSDQVVVQASAGQSCEVRFRLGDVILLDGESPEDFADATDSDVDPAALRRRRERGANLRGAGIGVIALGVALGAGAAFTSLAGTCGQDGAEGTDCNRDLRRSLAITFGVTGGLVVAGGVAMIVVGARKSRVQAAVLPTRRGAAFSVQGRF